MAETLTGIHHVTAIASDPQRNVDFYVGVLGLRLVKQTVNFDDPGTYHFYYGDELGRPGTILTFFPWPGARRGRQGAGQIGATAFSVPSGSLGFWTAHLSAAGVAISSPEVRFGEEVIAFTDPDGLPLEIVGDEAAGLIPGWDGGPLPAEHAIRGVHSVSLWEADTALTGAILRDTLGFAPVAEAGHRTRYHTAGSGVGTRVDVLHVPDTGPAAGGAGTVHHVAWRAADEAQQRTWRERIAAHGLRVTDVLDRQYFRSIYFREPGGVLFEIATDPPGFTLDETPDALGTSLKLPPWYEPQRATIERVLPPIRVPAGKGAHG